MEFVISSIASYRGSIYVNGVKCDVKNIENTALNSDGDSVVIDLIPAVQRVVVQPWMTQLNSLYNFHMSMNNGITMPATVMYGFLRDFSDKMYYGELSITPGSPVCWSGYIPRSAVLSLEEA